ncbi:FUSC family protein [Paenibacillus sp. J45TS6]|uniref:FUSC family protein n=1 Tax=unclassified Paenibacillus TaxID=185978 RepID=UPI001B2F327D|nr:FUSC family protein [Paenibacillus sp. J45TS6]GIP44946.1 FUSC family protein [Paenibacillus sp. J45TS6]
MKKRILTKTIIFICILLFIFVFNSVFSTDNTLIGVTIVIATLMYLDRDLTANPWKNFFLLLTVNLLQGIFGYISAIHMWIAIPLNFVSMFVVGYFFSFNLVKPLTIAFGLQYLFILTTPVPFETLPLRIMALIFGAVMIMAVQFLVNNNKMEKIGSKLLVSIYEQFIQKLEAIQLQKDTLHFNHTIEKSIKEIRKMIYHRTVDGYYVSNEGRIYLKISACLEKLHLLLDQYDESLPIDEFIQALTAELRNVVHFIRKEPLDGEKLQYLPNEEQTANREFASELFLTFEMIYELLEELQNTEKKELRKVEKLESIPRLFQKSYLHIANFNKNSVRFTYAVRLSISVTMAAFITDYFALEQGRWMMFTIFSVTQPYAEIAKFRFTERLKGTIMGAVIFFVLFSIFNSPSSHALIILLFGYLNSFAVAYRTIILTATVPALGTAAVVSGMGVVTFERILYVILGIGIGMLANRFILSHSIEKGTKDLVQMYKDTSRFLIEELYDFIKNPNPTNIHSIHHLFVISTLIEDRILLNNETRELKDANRFLENLRLVNHSIYELFLRVQTKKIDQATVRIILEEVDKIKDSSEEELDCLIKRDRHTNHERPTQTMYDSIVLNDVISIYQRFKKIMEFQAEYETFTVIN